jgi:hypothetical protein
VVLMVVVESGGSDGQGNGALLISGTGCGGAGGGKSLLIANFTFVQPAIQNRISRGEQSAGGGIGDDEGTVHCARVASVNPGYILRPVPEGVAGVSYKRLRYSLGSSAFYS